MNDITEQREHDAHYLRLLASDLLRNVPTLPPGTVVSLHQIAERLEKGHEEPQWTPTKVAPDLTPRMLCVGGPFNGQTRPPEFGMNQVTGRGEYVRVEEGWGGAVWRWKASVAERAEQVRQHFPGITEAQWKDVVRFVEEQERWRASGAPSAMRPAVYFRAVNNDAEQDGA